MQGVGVSAPIAADVADAVVGFARLEHMPNGMMFTIGTWSMMFAANWLAIFSRLVGNTTRLDGAAPKLH